MVGSRLISALLVVELLKKAPMRPSSFQLLGAGAGVSG